MGACAKTLTRYFVDVTRGGASEIIVFGIGAELPPVRRSRFIRCSPSLPLFFFISAWCQRRVNLQRDALGHDAPAFKPCSFSRTGVTGCRHDLLRAAVAALLPDIGGVLSPGRHPAWQPGNAALLG